jgi:hypothetical protein
MHARSPRLSARRQGVTTEQAAIATARAERLPRLTLNAAARGSSQTTQTAMGFPLSQLADIPDGQPFRNSHLNAELIATLPLYTGGRIGSAVSLAQAQRDLAKVNALDVERDLDFDVTSTYANLVQLDRDIQAAQESVSALTESRRVVAQMRGFDFTVVGLTKNTVGFNADPVIYARLEDAQNILFEPDPNLLRNIRRRTGSQVGGAEAVAPRLPETRIPKASAISENLHMINAIAVRVEPGVSIDEVAKEIEQWKHLEVFTSARQVNMQLMSANRLILMQLSLFRLLLLIIAGVIIGLITYTFTLDKIKDIAVLKLLGTQTSRIYSMIIQQAVLMGLLGTVVGALLEFASEPYFPRRVSSTVGDLGQMIVIITFISILASLVAVRRAMTVDPRLVLGT